MIKPTIISLLLATVIGLSVGCGDNTDSKNDNKSHQDSVYAANIAKSDSIRQAKKQAELELRDKLIDSIQKNAVIHIKYASPELKKWRKDIVDSAVIDTIIKQTSTDGLKYYVDTIDISVLDMNGDKTPEVFFKRTLYLLDSGKLKIVDAEISGSQAEPVKIGTKHFLLTRNGVGGYRSNNFYRYYTTYNSKNELVSFEVMDKNLWWSRGGATLSAETDSVYKVTYSGNTMTHHVKYYVEIDHEIYNRNLLDSVDWEDHDALKILEGNATINYTWQGDNFKVSGYTQHPKFVTVRVNHDNHAFIDYNEPELKNPNNYTGKSRAYFETCKLYDDYNGWEDESEFYNQLYLYNDLFDRIYYPASLSKKKIKVPYLMMMQHTGSSFLANHQYPMLFPIAVTDLDNNGEYEFISNPMYSIYSFRMVGDTIIPLYFDNGDSIIKNYGREHSGFWCEVDSCAMELITKNNRHLLQVKGYELPSDKPGINVYTNQYYLKDSVFFKIK